MVTGVTTAKYPMTAARTVSATVMVQLVLDVRALQRVTLRQNACDRLRCGFGLNHPCSRAVHELAGRKNGNRANMPRNHPHVGIDKIVVRFRKSRWSDLAERGALKCHIECGYWCAKLHRAGWR